MSETADVSFARSTGQASGQGRMRNGQYTKNGKSEKQAIWCPARCWRMNLLVHMAGQPPWRGPLCRHGSLSYDPPAGPRPSHTYTLQAVRPQHHLFLTSSPHGVQGNMAGWAELSLLVWTHFSTDRHKRPQKDTACLSSSVPLVPAPLKAWWPSPEHLGPPPIPAFPSQPPPGGSGAIPSHIFDISTN